MQVPLFVGNAFLVFRQALCIAANVTTNELLTRGRYSYMRRDDAFWNSFDRGCVSNCWQFWFLPRPEWASIYMEEQQAIMTFGLMNVCVKFMTTWSCKC